MPKTWGVKKWIFALVALLFLIGLAGAFQKTRAWSHASVANRKFCELRTELARWNLEFIEAGKSLKDDPVMTKLFNRGIARPVCDITKLALQPWAAHVTALDPENQLSFPAKREPSAESLCAPVEACERPAVAPWVETFDTWVSAALPQSLTLDPTQEQAWRQEINRLKEIAPKTHAQLALDTAAICAAVKDLARTRRISSYYVERCGTCTKHPDFRKVSELTRSQESRLRQNIEMFMIKWTDDPSARPECLSELQL